MTQSKRKAICGLFETLEEMPEMFKALYQSFYSRELYVRVASQWQGVGIKYLLLLTCILMIPIGVTRWVQMDSMVADAGFNNSREMFRHVVEQLPTLTLRKNKIESEGDAPVEVFLPNMEHPIITLNNQLPKNADDSKAVFTVVNDTIYSRDPLFGKRENRLQDITGQMGIEEGNEIKLTQAFLMRFEDSFVSVMNVLHYVYIIADGVSFALSFVIRALIYAGVVMVVASLLKLRLSFPASMRLSAVTSTPITCVLVLDATQTFHLLSYPLVVSMVVQLAYIYHACDSLKRAGITRVK